MKIDSWLQKPQPKLHCLGLLVLFISASMTAPFSLDMYTPAVPHMAEYFDTTPDIVNITLLGYVLFMAVGMLVFGPLSDKYGRRPVMVAGVAGYLVASVLCALSASIWMLIAARILQALGSGAMEAVATAAVKDTIFPEYREKMFSVIQIMFVIGPVGAPIVGAGILTVTDWRGTFWVLAGIGAVQLVLALLFKEPLEKSMRNDLGVVRSISRLGVFVKNKPFMFFLIATSAFEVGYMAYVSVGSYVYMDIFGFSAMGYSIFFAIAALACAAGPIVWLRLSKSMTIKRYTSISIIAALLLGVAELVFGSSSAYSFCIIFLAFAFFEASVRPYSVNVLLSQKDEDTGSASALINFMRTFVGCIGMWAVMLPWGDYISAVSMLMIIGMVVSVVLWVALLRGKSVLIGVKDGTDPEKLL